MLGSPGKLAGKGVHKAAQRPLPENLMVMDQSQVEQTGVIVARQGHTDGGRIW
jgi:hypothetical protein